MLIVHITYVNEEKEEDLSNKYIRSVKKTVLILLLIFLLIYISLARYFGRNTHQNPNVFLHLYRLILNDLCGYCSIFVTKQNE